MPPTPFVVSTIETEPPGRLLDIGAGNGRNSLWAASRGWEVTALDQDEKSARGIVGLVRQSSALNIRVEQSALLAYEPNSTYDAVVSAMVLHFSNDITDLAANVARMQELTRPGGLNVATFVDSRSPAGSRPFLVDPNDVLALYPSEFWQGVKFESAQGSPWRKPHEMLFVSRLAFRRASEPISGLTETDAD